MENIDVSILKTGDVILVHNPFDIKKPSSYLGPFIRFFDKTYYNHVKLVVMNVGNVPYINEALASGIRTSNAMNNLQGKNIIVLRPLESIKDEIAFIEKANSFIGIAKYDFDGTLFRQFIYQTTGYWINGKKDQNINEFYCSDYPSYMHNLKDWWKISPRQLLESNKFYVVYQNK